MAARESVYSHYPQQHGQGQGYDDYPPPPADVHYPTFPHQPYPDSSYEPAYRQPPRPMSSFNVLHKGASYASDISERSAADQSSNVGLNPPSKEKEAPGFFQRLFPNSWACRLYILSVVVETLVDLGIEADIYFLLRNSTLGNDDLKVRRLPVYLAIFALAHLFQLLLALDAVHARNTLQFIFLAVFNLLLLVYSLIQRSEIILAINPDQRGVSHITVAVLTVIIPVVIGVAEVVYIGLGFKIYTEFGWQVYKLLGADRRVKKMYMHFQIFICLVKFDLFFWIGFSVQWIFLILRNNDVERYITMAVLPLSILLLIEGHLAARHENKWLMISFMSGCVAACCYFSYKLYKIFAFRDSEELAPVFKTLTIFTVIAILILIVTCSWGVIVMRNFGAGLKFHMNKHKKGQAQPSSLARNPTVISYNHRNTVHLEMAGHNPNRMSID